MLNRLEIKVAHVNLKLSTIHGLVFMLNSNQKLIDSLVEKVDDCLSQAKEIFNQEFIYQAIDINIRGKAAGQVRFGKSGIRYDYPILRFNPAMLIQYKTQFIDEVVPHECAHLIVHKLNEKYFLSNKSKRIKPHGLEWQTVMKDVFARDPKVTHTFETNSPKRDSYLYQCGCSELTHRLGIIRHNRVMREQSAYRCKMCSQSLVFKDQREVWR